MVALLLWLVWVLLFGVVGSSSSSSGTATVRPSVRAAPAMRASFTIDGRSVNAERSIQLRRGELLVFVPDVTALTVKRLECHGDAHHIALAHRSWRVPDLPTGPYELDGRGANFGFSYLVRVRSHSAPCPGP